MSRVSYAYGMPYGDFVTLTKIPMENWRCLRPELDAYFAGTGYLIIGNQTITDGRGLAELFVSVNDGPSKHILLFPTLSIKHEWHFRNQEDEFGPIGSYMDCNGVEIAAPGVNDPALIPGVPRVMREWLICYGVLDLSGIAKLRPMMADWGEEY